MNRKMLIKKKNLKRKIRGKDNKKLEKIELVFLKLSLLSL